MHNRIRMIDDVSSEELLNACIEHIGNVEQREKIENLKDEILHAIDEYKMKAASGKLYAMSHMDLDDDVKETLISIAGIVGYSILFVAFLVKSGIFVF